MTTPPRDPRFTAEKIGKRIDLLEPRVMKTRRSLPPFRLQFLDGPLARPDLAGPTDGWPEIGHGDYWAGGDRHFLLRTTLAVPQDFSAPFALHFPLGGLGDIFNHPEALLSLDGAPIASADRHHHLIELDPAIADGAPRALALQGWTGLSGWPPDPSDRRKLMMGDCALVALDAPLRDLLTLARCALDVATTIDDALTSARILAALDRAFLTLDSRDPLADALTTSAPHALAQLRRDLDDAGPPAMIDLIAVGHAHMDVAYLWTIDEIRQKNARTYANVLRLMEKRPAYRFSHSQPFLYQLTKEDFPELYAQIRARVLDGRWEVMGGMWVEPDVNIAGPEALARQLVLGRRFFEEEFGAVETPVLWLPDSFGFPATLPQLMKQAGLSWFVTNKLSWNQVNPMPATTTFWRGLDGSEVLAQFLTTPRPVQHLPFPTNYKSDLSAAEVLGTLDHARPKRGLDELMICFGYGDGGGGPTDALIDRAEAYRALPGAPKLRMGHVRDYFERLEARIASGDLRPPTWSGELYMEGHRGVFTSQGWIKRANRRLEARLHDAEFLEAAAGLGPSLEDAWKRLCTLQFHDIVTGVAIGAVYDDARRETDAIARAAEKAAAAALDVLRRDAPQDARFLALSTTDAALPRIAHVAPDPGPLRRLDDGSALRRQAVEDGALIDLGAPPPFSIIALGAAERDAGDGPSVTGAIDAGGALLEHDGLRVRFDAAARLVSVFDKEEGREVLAPGAIGDRLEIAEDRPLAWDAWDIDPFIDDRVETIDGLARFELVERGPLRATLLIERRFRRSWIRQRVSLRARSKRIDFACEVEWRERHLLLRTAFPTAILAERAVYDIQWGEVERPTHRSTSWDAAKFECCAQRFVDLAEGAYGAALLNDGKYGHGVEGGELRLSLVKSATSPDPEADQGRHHFTYAFLAHRGADRRTVRAEAYDLAQPARLVPIKGGAGGLAATPLVACAHENVQIETIKPADDGEGVVLRLFEHERRRGPVTLRFATPPARAWRCDLLERPIAALSLDGAALRLDLRPFEIVTLKIA